MRFLQLGASLYVPATRDDLTAIGNRQKFPHLRSVIFCTEDAVHESELPCALDNVESMLRALEPVPLMRFVRVRNLAVLRAVLQMDGARHLTGFVLPKVTQYNLEEYYAALRPEDPFKMMPTLETVEVFNIEEMNALRDLLLQERYRRRLMSLRIGGNDLFHLLGLRRPRNRTIYSTPVASVISQLATVFRPHGLNLTAAVFEYLDGDRFLRREVRSDLSHGLFGKAAIHPRQVPLIEANYRVDSDELHMAEKILSGTAPAVFRLHNAMCEPATHSTWAKLIHERAKIYGIKTLKSKTKYSHPFPRNGSVK